MAVATERHQSVEPLTATEPHAGDVVDVELGLVRDQLEAPLALAPPLRPLQHQPAQLEPDVGAEELDLLLRQLPGRTIPEPLGPPAVIPHPAGLLLHDSAHMLDPVAGTPLGPELEAAPGAVRGR